MRSSQHHIIAQVESWLHQDKPVWLCTILQTWGSSPRPVGAMMACTMDGELAGSISGGCIEEDFLEQLREGSLRQRYADEQRPFVVHYGVSEEEQARLRLPCGGQLHVLIEYLPPDQTHQRVFDELNLALDEHRRISRVVNLQTGEITSRDVSLEEVVRIDNNT